MVRSFVKGKPLDREVSLRGSQGWDAKLQTLKFRGGWVAERGKRELVSQAFGRRILKPKAF